MNDKSLAALLLAYANQLKFKYLFFIVAGLLAADLLVPDFIPFIDEIILGMLAVILGNWKKERARKQPGELIEGEVVGKDEAE